MQRTVNSDLIGGSAGLLLAAAFWLGKESNWSFWSAVFPNVVIIIIATLSLLLVVKGFVRPARLTLFEEGSRVKMLVTAVALLAWGVAFSRLGTITSSLIGFAGLALYLASGSTELTLRKVLVGAIVVAVEIAVFYLIFTRVLYVPLPRGIFF